ncbi:MAG: hypothetical protein EZS28_054400, partial [Streblomastix strix]
PSGNVSQQKRKNEAPNGDIHTLSPQGGDPLFAFNYFIIRISSMADLSEYNVINGLPGLGPDIMLEILSELRLIPDAIHIIGINKITLQLKNHDRFYKIIESLSFPIQLINPDLQEIDFIDVDDVRKKIRKKISNKISKKINYKTITVSLDQVLENGIWQIEVVLAL